MAELLILSRVLHFGACLVLVAIFAIRLLVERPAADHAPGRGLAALCLAVAAGSGFLWFWVSVAGMSGDGMMASLNPQLFQLVLEQTQPGRVWLIRLAIAMALAVVLCVPRGRWRWIAGAVLSATFTASLAWLGHAGAGEDGRRSLMLCADVAHLLAASLWPAGLLPFALLILCLRKQGAIPAVHAVIRRFSAMSLITVAILAGSGVVNACFLVGSFRALFGTAYGQFLVAKTIFFIVAVACGARNLFVHKPLLDTYPAAMDAIWRNVWFELALSSAIIVVVAIMGTLPPGSQPAG